MIRVSSTNISCSVLSPVSTTAGNDVVLAELVAGLGGGVVVGAVVVVVTVVVVVDCVVGEGTARGAGVADKSSSQGGMA